MAVNFPPLDWNNQTLSQYVTVLNQLADEHPQVAQFGYGAPAEISVREDKKFPLMWLVQQPSVLAENSITFKLRMYLMDQVNKEQAGTNSNNLFVKSDLSTVIWDVLTQLRDTYDLEPNFATQAIPFDNTFEEGVSGWYTDIALYTPYEYGACDTPGFNGGTAPGVRPPKPPFNFPFIYVGDTPSVDLTGLGSFSDPVLADVNLSHVSGNTLHILSDGLYVSGGTGGSGNAFGSDTWVQVASGGTLFASSGLTWNPQGKLLQAHTATSSFILTDDLLLFQNDAGDGSFQVQPNFFYYQGTNNAQFQISPGSTFRYADDSVGHLVINSGSIDMFIAGGNAELFLTNNGIINFSNNQLLSNSSQFSLANDGGTNLFIVNPTTGMFTIPNLASSGTSMVVADSQGNLGIRSLPVMLASNGLSVSGNTVVLGQDTSSNTTGPAILTSTRYIPLNNNAVTFVGSTGALTVDPTGALLITAHYGQGGGLGGALQINRNITTASADMRGVYDQTLYTGSGTLAYAAFDANPQLFNASAVTYDHLVNFQARGVFDSAGGSINNLYGFYSSMYSKHGTASTWYDFYANIMNSGSGVAPTVTTRYNFYAEADTRATNSYGIWINGQQKNYFDGKVMIGTKAIGDAGFPFFLQVSGGTAIFSNSNPTLVIANLSASIISTHLTKGIDRASWGLNFDQGIIMYDSTGNVRLTQTFGSSDDGNILQVDGSSQFYGQAVINRSGGGSSINLALSAANFTAATQAQKQVSPSLQFVGAAWRTNLFPVSVQGLTRQYMEPSSGTTSISVKQHNEYSLDGGSTWSSYMLFDSATNALTIPGSYVGTGLNLTFNTTGNMLWDGNTLTLTPWVTNSVSLVNNGVSRFNNTIIYAKMAGSGTTAHPLLSLDVVGDVGYTDLLPGSGIAITSGATSYTIALDAPTGFTLANNQSSPANVTGILLNSGSTVGFQMDYSISRIFTSGFTTGQEDAYVADTIGTGPNLTFNNVFQVGQQSTGKMIFVGSTTLTNFNGQYVPVGIFRLNSDFTLDSSFVTNAGFGFNNTAAQIAIDANDKIYVVGSFTTYNGTTMPGAGGLLRLNSDGTLDTAFMTNLGTGFGTTASAIAVQSDGKILVGGGFTTFNGNTRNRIVRLNSDGTEDTAFYTNIGTGVNANSIQCFAIDSSGNIIFTGNFASVNGTTTGKICRVSSNGTVDATWNSNVGTTGFATVPSGAVTQANNQTLVFGGFTSFRGNTRNRLVRLNSDGTEDTTFYTNLGTGAFNNTTAGVAMNAAGTLIMVCGSFTTVGTNARNRIVVLNSDGTDNSTINATLGFGYTTATAQPFFLSDGRAVIVGANGYLSGTVNFFNRNLRSSIVALYMQPTNSNLNGVGTLSGYFNPETHEWMLNNQLKSGDMAGVAFSITPAGQLQYTTTNLLGTNVTSQLKYQLKTF